MSAKPHGSFSKYWISRNWPLATKINHLRNASKSPTEDVAGSPNCGISDTAACICKISDHYVIIWCLNKHLLIAQLFSKAVIGRGHEREISYSVEWGMNKYKQSWISRLHVTLKMWSNSIPDKSMFLIILFFNAINNWKRNLMLF